MKKKRKSVFLILLAAGLLGCSAQKEQPVAEKETETAKMDTLRVGMFFPGVPESELELVGEEVSKITREKIGVSVELFNDATTGDIIGRNMNGYEQLDIITISKYTLYEHYLNGNLVELTGLLDQYGKKLTKELGEDMVASCAIGGSIYGIPSKRTYAYGSDAYVMRKDVLEKYQIAPESIQTYEDLEQVFALIKEKEPNMEIVAPKTGTMLSNQYYSDAFYGVYMLGVHLDYGRKKNLTNVFESRDYRDALYRVRNWHQKGYLNMDVFSQQNDTMKKAYNGELFCYATKWEPGLLNNGANRENEDWVCVQLGEDALGYNNIPMYLYCISSNTVSQEKSMELLELLFTDEKIVNLLTYGIEGVHYQKTDDDHVKNLDDGSSNPFYIGEWSKPNQALSYVWEGNPLNLWEEKDAYNKNSIQACDIGFNFDIEPVATQYFAAERIYDKYRDVIENGLVDPDEALTMLKKEMRAAGIDDVIQEQQRQFDLWDSQKRGAAGLRCD